MIDGLESAAASVFSIAMSVFQTPYKQSSRLTTLGHAELGLTFRCFLSA